MALHLLSQPQLKVCNDAILENVADVSYVAVDLCHFWSKFSKFWIQNAYSSGPEAIGGPKRSKRRSKTLFLSTKNWPKLYPKLPKKLTKKTKQGFGLHLVVQTELWFCVENSMSSGCRAKIGHNRSKTLFSDEHFSPKEPKSDPFGFQIFAPYDYPLYLKSSKWLVHY